MDNQKKIPEGTVSLSFGTIDDLINLDIPRTITNEEILTAIKADIEMLKGEPRYDAERAKKFHDDNIDAISYATQQRGLTLGIKMDNDFVKNHSTVYKAPLNSVYNGEPVYDEIFDVVPDEVSQKIKDQISKMMSGIKNPIKHCIHEIFRIYSNTCFSDILLCELARQTSVLDVVEELRVEGVDKVRILQMLKDVL